MYASKKEPKYAVGTSTLYADAHRDLTVFWRNQKIERACLVYVWIWNNGNQPIDAGDIPISEPILIEPQNPVHILNASAASKRPELGLTANLIDSSKPSYVRVSWKQDEALEPNEGGVIRILYEAKNPVAFHVKGRVKGAPEGFTKHLSGTYLNRSTAWTLITSRVVYLVMGAVFWLFSDQSARDIWNKVHQLENCGLKCPNTDRHFQ